MLAAPVVGWDFVAATDGRRRGVLRPGVVEIR
jgi:hypothetical protein